MHSVAQASTFDNDVKDGAGGNRRRARPGGRSAETYGTVAGHSVCCVNDVRAA